MVGVYLRLFVAAAILVFSVWSFAQHRVPVIPDSKMTPGQVCTTRDRDFGGYRYRIKVPVCDRVVSESLKNRIYRAYGIPDRCHSQYTIDHLIPLSAGGNNEIENLWPEHRAIKLTRVHLESYIHEEMRNGRMNQQQAIQAVIKAKLNPRVGPNHERSNCP